MSQEMIETTPQQRSKGWRRAGRIAFTTLSWTGFIVVMAGLATLMALIIGPRVLGWNGVIVLSGSMEPALKTGGVAYVEPRTAEQIQVGDVMTFRAPLPSRNLITHRVVEKTYMPMGIEFITKGDANQIEDTTPVKANQVVGVVRFDLPMLGNFVEVLRDRQNYYLILGLPAAALILNELATIGLELRRSRRAKSPPDALLVDAEGASS